MRLKNVRNEYKKTQEDIAKILDVKRNTYSMWELEHDTIPLKKLIILSEYYDVSLDYLLGLNNLKQYKNSMPFDKNKYLIRLKDIRKSNLLTQDLLTDILNTTNSVISRYESGITFILTMFLVEYSKIFNLSTDYIMGKIDKPIKLKIETIEKKY